MVEVSAQADHIGGDDGVEERGDHASGQDLADDLGKEVGAGPVEAACLLVHEEGALLDEELEGRDG